MFVSPTTLKSTHVSWMSVHVRKSNTFDVTALMSVQWMFVCMKVLILNAHKLKTIYETDVFYVTQKQLLCTSTGLSGYEFEDFATL